METVKVYCTKSASNALMAVKRVTSILLQMRQLRDKVGFVVVSGLAKNVNFLIETAFMNHIVEKITPKLMPTTLVKSGTVANLDLTQEALATPINDADH